MSAERSSQRTLVTGASGFLGGRVVEAMQLSRWGFPVGTVRHWTRAARPARYGSEIVVCDIRQPSEVAEAARSVDAIVHCAYTDDHDSIVGGTRNLLAAALEQGVSRFVYLSSAEVYDTSTVGPICEENATPPMPGRDYKNAKIEAERVCREFAARGLAVTILRPSLIYGPFGQSWSMDIAERLQSGKWGLFDDRDGIANLIYIDDVVRAILLSLTADGAVGETFNLNGPDRVTWNDYFLQFNEALELPPLRHISPAKSGLRTLVLDRVGAVADAILDRFEDQLMEIYLRGGIASRLMKKVKSELDATPTGTELNDLYRRQFFLLQDKARDLLGFEPAFNLDTGLRHTVAWLKHHERLKRHQMSGSHADRAPASSNVELVSP